MRDLSKKRGIIIPLSGRSWKLLCKALDYYAFEEPDPNNSDQERVKKLLKYSQDQTGRGQVDRRPT